MYGRRNRKLTADVGCSIELSLFDKGRGGEEWGCGGDEDTKTVVHTKRKAEEKLEKKITSLWEILHGSRCAPPLQGLQRSSFSRPRTL